MTKVTVFLILPLILHFVAASDDEEELNLVDSEIGKICISPPCVKAAANVLKNIDINVDPCDDFYSFACGGFIKKISIPDDKTRINFFNIIGDGIIEKLRRVFEEPIQSGELKAFSLIKKFYKTCMNTKKIEEGGLNNIKKLLRGLGGWPVVEGAEWEEDKFDWKEMLYNFRKLGISTDAIMKVYVGKDVTNSSSNKIINIDHGWFGLQREYLIEGFENEVVKGYYSYLVDVAINFGAEKDRALKEMKEVVEFAKELAESAMSKEDRRNISLITNRMTLTTLQEKIPFIQWSEFFRNLMSLSNVTLLPSDIVDIGDPQFIESLEIILNRTPKRVQANYLLTQLVISSIKYLTKNLRDRELEYEEVQQGAHSMQARWKECTVLAARKLNVAADALYVRNYFSDDAKANAMRLIDNLKRTFLGTLKKIDWMDEETRKEALEKAEKMTARVGYPEELRNDRKVEEYYANLDPTTDNFLEYSFEIRKFNEDRLFGKLIGLDSETEWAENTFVCTVDAYYNMMENSIQLPAGILQGNFFDNERPNYMNYGSMGFAIAHEITHGFDDEGRQYDKDGNLYDWWAERTSELFVEKAQCIIDQYSSYRIPEINLQLNAINTQGENIADNGGVKQAYLAYQNWVAENGEEPRLPGLKFSQRQLFWISTANLWCEKLRVEAIRQQVLTNAHVPSKFRVIVPFSNSKEFAQDFNCPVGSNMNPELKCSVW